MTHSDFSMGIEFISGGRRWRCTDIGRRIIAAVCLSDHPDDQSWYNGPPYAVAETVFDENDIEGCTRVDDGEGGISGTEESTGHGEILAYLAKRDAEITTDELTDVVALRHHDGSMFLLTNARLERHGEWLLLFGEHHAPGLFHQDDVAHWTSKERSASEEQRDSSWHYQAYRSADGVVQIYEDYFDESGVWRGRTEEAIAPLGESTEELVIDLFYMLSDAVIRPVKGLESGNDS